MKREPSKSIIPGGCVAVAIQFDQRVALVAFVPFFGRS